MFLILRAEPTNAGCKIALAGQIFKGKKKKKKEHRTPMIPGPSPRLVCLTHAHTCRHTQTCTDCIFCHFIK